MMGIVGGIRPRGVPDPAPFQILEDGIWSWFTNPRAVHRNGATYIGWVDEAGTVGVAKHADATGVVTSTPLSATALDDDDHSNPGLIFLPDGRLAAHYSKHNDTSGTRWRISSSAEDISSFAAEVLKTNVTKPVTYSNPHYLSATSKTYMFFRAGPGGIGTNPIKCISSADHSTWDAERTWIDETDHRPYVQSCSNGVDRIDFLFTNGHPGARATSIYHCYMQLDAGAEKFYTSDGTYIGTSVTPAAATLVYDGSTTRSWTWDIRYGADGHPRVLFTRFPSTTDHRYMFSRWTGSAWTTPVEIAPAGSYLYGSEPYYSGGICFDAGNPDAVFLSRVVGSQWEIQEWRTADGGTTWTKRRDITSGSAAKNCRPCSPRNRASGLACIWWRGSYSSYTTYDTALWGVGAAS